MESEDTKANTYGAHYGDGDLDFLFLNRPRPARSANRSQRPVTSDREKVASDGGPTSYYNLPEHATELRHLISYKNMSKSRGDIFKACYRLGEKEGVDIGYELNKMKFFIEDLLEMYERKEHV